MPLAQPRVPAGQPRMPPVESTFLSLSKTWKSIKILFPLFPRFTPCLFACTVHYTRVCIINGVHSTQRSIPQAKVNHWRSLSICISMSCIRWSPKWNSWNSNKSAVFSRFSLQVSLFPLFAYPYLNDFATGTAVAEDNKKTCCVSQFAG